LATMASACACSFFTRAWICSSVAIAFSVCNSENYDTLPTELVRNLLPSKGTTKRGGL
jgi:hypothetical protein